MISTRKTGPIATIVLHLVLLLCVIFALFPLFFTFQASLQPGNQLYATELRLWPAAPTLDNYRKILFELPMGTWLRNSFTVAIATTLATLVIAVSAAYALSRFKFRGRANLMSVMLALQAFPSLLALFAYYLLLSQLNLTNSLFGLTLVYSASAIVLNIWNLKGFFDTIPVDLEEAAMIDGCTPTQAFLRVMLPLARPALATTALFGFLAGWNEYIIAQTLLFDEKLYTAPVGIFGLQDGYRNPWGWFAAASFVVSVPVVILFLFLQRNLISGLTQGGVKG